MTDDFPVPDPFVRLDDETWEHCKAVVQDGDPDCFWEEPPDEDSVADWLLDGGLVVSELGTPSEALYAHYRAWCAEHGVPCPAHLMRWGRKLAGGGFPSRKCQGRAYKSLRVTRA